VKVKYNPRIAFSITNLKSFNIRKIVSFPVSSALIICGMLVVSSFSGRDMAVPRPNLKSTPVPPAPKDIHGISSAIPAYYDGKIFNIIFVEFPPKAEATLILKNPGINFIYQSDPGLPGGQPFISVIDAIPTDGMNPVWREVQITFNTGFTPRQLYSDNEVLAAAAGLNPEISLTFTSEVYYCPIVGQKH
jgi:hypothetical protein